MLCSFYSAFPAAGWQRKKANIDFADVLLFGMGTLQAFWLAEGLFEWLSRGAWQIASMYGS